MVLSGENRRHFWIPEGFAHGFAVLSEYATFTYLCTETYDRDADAGVRWNDAQLAIDWPVAEPLLSEKDTRAPLSENQGSRGLKISSAAFATSARLASGLPWRGFA